MTPGQSLFIIILTLANIAGCIWLLWWTRRSPGEASTTEHTTGHVWDEDLTELNNPLPRWWLWLFVITVAFGVAYFVLYPGLGTWKGTLGWTSQAEHAADAKLNAARIEKTLAPYATRLLGELTTDSAALNIGRNLFLNNCATCHGSDGGGAPGFPNLTDKDWLWGGDPDTVLATVSNGRMGVMPAWGEALGSSGVENVLAYVMSLSGRKLEAGDTAAGKQKFAELCSACHGLDGRGNAVMGAPNLTDGTWLHGGSLGAVRETIEKGRTGTMPAHVARLGETRVKLLAAYVLSLGRMEPQTVAAGNGADVPASH
ncbi:MAG TPA: cytochrome-c oxidase, cbb3-type subunit III [Steroidobacteraceae bacterium]